MISIHLFDQLVNCSWISAIKMLRDVRNRVEVIPFCKDPPLVCAVHVTAYLGFPHFKTGIPPTILNLLHMI